MKSMKAMQNEMFDKCYKNNGWPKPFVHLLGVVRLVRDQEEKDRAKKSEILALLIALSLSPPVFFTLVYLISTF